MNTPRINPRIDPDDPKWTAYVLGEVSEAERIEIEQLLETSDEARALVEELSMATMSLKDELAPMTLLMMTPEQRAVVESAAQPAPVKRNWLEVFPSKWGWGLAAAAAGLALVVGLPMLNRDYQSVVDKTALEGDTRQPEAPVEREAIAPAVQVAEGRSQETKAAQAASAPVAVAPVIPAAAVATLLQEQRAGGSVGGTVHDPSGASMPGVTIQATERNTGVAVTTVSNESGAYNFPSLPAGTYQVSASLPGFQTKTVTGLEVSPTVQLRQNIPMNIANMASTVEVSVSADQILPATGTSVGGVLPQQTVQNLPMVGNDVLELLKVMPGTNVRIDGFSTGQTAQNINTTRDGLSVTDSRFANGPFGQPAGVPPPAASPTQGGAAGGRGGGGGGRGGAAGAAAPREAEERLRQASPPPPAPISPPPATRPTLATPVVGAFAGAPATIVNNNFSVGPNTEAYDRVVDNPFIRATQEQLATFSIDVDTASYSNMRRFLTQNQRPPRDSVRIEELINYFSYDYAGPTGNAPIAPNMEVATAPWNPANRLVRIGIKARDINANRRPPSNLVFLIDVSGSMNTPVKLPLVKAGLKMMVDRLGENDTVSIVVYASASGLVLAPTSAMRKDTIQQAIDSLQPGGSTNGASGIQLAYNQAVANFIRGGTNRVILMTDGDFNVGVTNQGDLTRLIEERAKSGVFLSVLGFGMGNIKDSTLEKLADQGNGHYAYIDNIAEARKVLVEEMGGTLVTVAKDVKIQVDFNPARVEAYRLIGYENRVLRTEDFNNDLKDAGDMGAGHTVTALFEVVPKGGSIPGPSIDPSKYTAPPQAAALEADRRGNASQEMLTLRLRYKLPEASTSTRMDVPLVDRGNAFARATSDFRFAASVAQFGMILRDSPYRGNATLDAVLDTAEGSRGQDRNGYRQEFIELVQRAKRLR